MALSYKSALNSFIAKFKALTSVEAIEAKASASDPCFDELQQTANSECQRLTTAIEHVKSSKEDIDKQMQTLLPILREIEPQMKRIDELQKVVRLLRIFQRVKNVNDKLSDNFSKKLTKSSEIQANILNSVDLVHSMNQMCTDFIRFSSNDNAFKCYLKSVCDHWTETTKKHVEPLFDSVLKQIGWPLSTNYSMMPSQFPADALQSFKSYFKALLKLQSPSEFKDDSIEKVVRITLPMQLMITHFQKRFIFHFMTNSRTNQLDKPEWYLTQVLTWIKDHEEFVVRHVDPILSNFAVDHNVNFTSAKLQITCGLIKLIETKLETDLKNLLYDDKLFSHTFDETLLFIREIEPIFNYNKSLLNANCQLLNTFGQEQYFAKLIKLEKKKSMEFVENILNSNSAWSPIINLDDEDELKVPECADNFVLMLQSVIG
ncbi:RAD50-interacting protein 1-like protein [Dinothrombium tinctorium]|uniref:RAD50-interacting protein 1-like protein n=1 Tax=Dinothrombium tinctorium TaxID=1965070 RepID=A0A3S3P167_9ACAR|nr:RAD50-interacting protein 1-like protein [Dinothrombium tinctorium]